jgi:heme exporter protein D
MKSVIKEIAELLEIRDTEMRRAYGRRFFWESAAATTIPSAILQIRLLRQDNQILRVVSYSLRKQKSKPYNATTEKGSEPSTDKVTEPCTAMLKPSL